MAQSQGKTYLSINPCLAIVAAVAAVYLGTVASGMCPSTWHRLGTLSEDRWSGELTAGTHQNPCDFPTQLSSQGEMLCSSSDHSASA